MCIFTITIKPYNPRLNIKYARHFCSQLKSGNPAAHTLHRLLLLRSRPDKVHGNMLHETGLSSPLTNTGYTFNTLTRIITPAIADCRFRAPLTPRLVRLWYIKEQAPLYQVLNIILYIFLNYKVNI